ncbi:hypothetical protein JTB14_037360 [Gonioctena quinquepunctata]|nr:hypothetical protein JTB14_037360 [Gonioctena quinquepunctata]
MIGQNINGMCTLIFRMLLIIGLLETVLSVRINRLQVPEIAQLGDPVVLDCDYTLEESLDDGLVVKWFFNEKPTPIYQWIPKTKPREMGILKGRLNLDYSASEDTNSVHRALHIIEPGPDLSGNYTCMVSTFRGEDIKTKRMLVLEERHPGSKFCPRAMDGVMVGYCDENGWFRFWTGKKVVVSRDYKFSTENDNDVIFLRPFERKETERSVGDETGADLLDAKDIQEEIGGGIELSDIESRPESENTSAADFQEAKNQLEEMRKGKEARSTTPPPTLTAKVTDPPTSLYPEAVAMQPNGQTDISMVEVTIKTTPQKPPSSLYPNVVITTQQDGQAKRKEEVTELSPDEEKVRDIKRKIESLPQLDGPTDPSSDFESTDEGNSPITKGKAKKARRLRRMDVKEDTSSSKEEEEGKTPSKNRGINNKEKEKNPSKQIPKGKKLSQQSPPIILEERPIINKKEINFQGLKFITADIHGQCICFVYIYANDYEFD